MKDPLPFTWCTDITSQIKVEATETKFKIVQESFNSKICKFDLQIVTQKLSAETTSDFLKHGTEESFPPPGAQK